MPKSVQKRGNSFKEPRKVSYHIFHKNFLFCPEIGRKQILKGTLK